MTVSTPDWLTLHDGQLLPYQHGMFMVMLAGQPQYYLLPVPVTGKFGCRITMTNNGKRLDGSATYPTAAEALRGGLEELRKTLGW